jgi:hypothetical protein
LSLATIFTVTWVYRFGARESHFAINRKTLLKKAQTYRRVIRKDFLRLSNMSYHFFKLLTLFFYFPFSPRLCGAIVFSLDSNKSFACLVLRYCGEVF